jgi:hypothetical protein
MWPVGALASATPLLASSATVTAAVAMMAFFNTRLIPSIVHTARL